MSLSYTTHEPDPDGSRRERADILQHGGTPQEKIVGYSYKSFHEGKRHHEITDRRFNPVYTGPSIVDGLTQLEAILAGQN